MTIPLHKKLSKVPTLKKKHVTRLIKSSFWFILGAVFGFFFFISFLYIYYKQTHINQVYEGVLVDGVDFGGKTQDEVRIYFAQKNKHIKNSTIQLTDEKLIATISAKQIDFGYDENLLATQALSIGRSGNLLSDISIMLQAYMQGLSLPPAYRYKEDVLDRFIVSLRKKIDIKPIDALFKFENGKVTAFQLPHDGRGIDTKKLKEDLLEQLASPMISDIQIPAHIKIPVVITKPKIAEDAKGNDMGVKELVATGTSLFQHSIENRIYNVGLAATRLNGILIKPDEVFSVTKTIGDVSALTGYKQAYVIQNGKTVLGDGGGVCQVSTTLFRAALNAGLPIVERHPHAYRVGYYEEDSAPGIDAAIYYPTVDLKFKNDTGHYLLIQTVIDYNEQRLTFNLYGTRDNRQTVVNQPVILSTSPAPETLFQDDPTLPKGQLKQVDFAAGGANVYFTRTVKKDGKVVLSDKFVSNYRPWQAIFLRGTKE